MHNNWTKIEDLSRFMIKGGLKQYHPDDPRHTPYWRKLKKMCIEGFWAEDFGKLRHMPGRLFYYGNFGTIELTNPDDNTRFLGRPLISDLEWERSYNFLEAEGFSGWQNDSVYTSDESIHDYKKNWGSGNKTLESRLFKKDGTFKEYVPARELIRMLRNEGLDLGAALYYNTTKNLIEMGSRGGGKTYFYSIAGALYRLAFDGTKYYTEEARKNPQTAKVLIGSGRTDKSSQFTGFMEVSMDALARKNELGAWGKIGDADYQPSPFYKDMKGSLKPNNKDNPWRHEYSMNLNGRWIDGYGTKSAAYHVNYSTQKRDGAEAGAGGSYSDVYYEEIGLTELLIQAYGSNRATVQRGGTQFGTQVFLGTSGNIETVGPAKKIFSRPQDYDCLGFVDVWEGSIEPIGFFLPAYLTNRKYKDENGNTKFTEAIEYYNKERAKAAASDDPAVLRAEKMNHPMVPSDMWQTNKGHILPAAEAEERTKVLFKDATYKKIGTPIRLRWDSTKRNGIDYDIVHNAEPFYEFPIESNQQRTTLDGAIMIYDMPVEIRDQVPDDMYVFSHDPYVSDEWDKGGSLGVTHVWLNPKYWDTHMGGSPLVATYIGKPKGGKKEYYENLEKLMAFYGDPTRHLWYEANRGEYCRGFFHRKNKAKLLCLRPQKEKGDGIYQKSITQYGFMVGNQIAKIAMIDDLSDFLLKPIESLGGTLVIETLPCIFSLRQIVEFNPKEGNFDAVSSMMGFPLFIREEEHRLLNEMRNKQKKRNPMAFLSVNSRVLPNVNKHIQRQEEWQ